jgi:hypothetical protein
MRLALLIGYRPGKGNQGGPVVSLPEGNWKIVAEKIIDTIINVATDFPGVSPVGLMLVPGPCKCRCEIVKDGSESYINVFAEKINDY